MLSILIASAFALAAAKRPSVQELSHYSFERFVEDFGLEMPQGSAEWNIRKAIFDEELARVVAHNSKDSSFKRGINKFSAMTKAEKKSLYGFSKGAKKNHKPVHHFKFNKDTHNIDINALPREVDWRKSGVVTAVKDQGSCGSCWAFASTATLESHAAINTGLLFDLSTEQIAMCAPNPDQCGGTGGCDGSTAELAYDYLSGVSGIVQEFQYGYESYYGQNFACNTAYTAKPKVKVTGYSNVPTNDYHALMNAVATLGPIAINIDASDWHNYHGGIYSGLDASPDINHVVVLVGYGHDETLKQDYWLVRNSWSPTWGEEGYIRLARSAKDAVELCAMDVTPQDGVACAGQNEPVKVCGTSGVLYDGVYPVGVTLA